MTQMIKDINGVDIYANRAVNDKDGNQIDTTYAKESELSEYAKTEDIPSIDGLMAEDKLGYDEEGKIKSYDGTEFAGSGGGMSTVNTSLPIKGDGSEDNPVTADVAEVDYQQIVHDDSLVHVSNNAQYALGVNMNMFGNWVDITDKITKTQSSYTWHDLKFYYNDALKMCMLSAYWTPDTASSWSTLLTINDVKYAPIYNCHSVTASEDVSSQTFSYINVRTDLRIMYSNMKPRVGAYGFYIIYPCQGGN